MTTMQQENPRMSADRGLVERAFNRAFPNLAKAKEPQPGKHAWPYSEQIERDAAYWFGEWPYKPRHRAEV